MSGEVARLRMFAGPNGSGKTTVKIGLQRSDEWFGIYINPDELERTIQESGFLSLEAYGLSTNTEDVRNFFASSTLLQIHHLESAAASIRCEHNRLDFSGLEFSSYFASVLSDFLRRKALEAARSFTFETVMSAPDKVDLLRTAQARGFRTYLYYIATEDPAINIQRVKNRVADGGTTCPMTKLSRGITARWPYCHKRFAPPIGPSFLIPAKPKRGISLKPPTGHALNLKLTKCLIGSNPSGTSSGPPSHDVR